MTTVRLAQGVLFGLFLGSKASEGSTSSGPGPVLATLLLVLAVVFYVTAARSYLAEDDPDAPPPKWMTMTESMTPTKAFLVGGGLLVIGASASRS